MGPSSSSKQPTPSPIPLFDYSLSDSESSQESEDSANRAIRALVAARTARSAARTATSVAARAAPSVAARTATSVAARTAPSVARTATSVDARTAPAPSVAAASVAHVQAPCTLMTLDDIFDRVKIMKKGKFSKADYQFLVDAIPQLRDLNPNVPNLRTLSAKCEINGYRTQNKEGLLTALESFVADKTDLIAGMENDRSNTRTSLVEMQMGTWKQDDRKVTEDDPCNLQFRLLNVLFSERHYTDFISTFSTATRAELDENLHGINHPAWGEITNSFNQDTPEAAFDNFISGKLGLYEGIDPGPVTGEYTKKEVRDLWKKSYSAIKVCYSRFDVSGNHDQGIDKFVNFVQQTIEKRNQNVTVYFYQWAQINGDLVTLARSGVRVCDDYSSLRPSVVATTPATNKRRYSSSSGSGSTGRKKTKKAVQQDDGLVQLKYKSVARQERRWEKQEKERERLELLRYHNEVQMEKERRLKEESQQKERERQQMERERLELLRYNNEVQMEKERRMREGSQQMETMLELNKMLNEEAAKPNPNQIIISTLDNQIKAISRMFNPGGDGGANALF